MSKVHPFIAFCELAFVSPDTRLSYAELAARYTKYTGKPMTPQRVKVLDAEWRAYSQTVRSVTIGTMSIDPTWFDTEED